MIVACPSCATRYDLPAQRFEGGGAMVRCSSCGHSWIESRASEIIDVPALLALPGPNSEPDRDVERLLEATRAAQQKFAEARARRRSQVRRWTAFAAALAIPFLFAAGFPELVVRTAPAAMALYERAGIPVNIYGLDFRRVEQQHMLVDGTIVLAVKGEIVNVAGNERKVPALRFILRDGAKKEVYAWTLDSAVRPLRTGEVTNFVTRVASPPETAKDLEIRFARLEEIGSSASGE
ncbi:zinc-ribbon domain-containing protein [soil metagenome]